MKTLSLIRHAKSDWSGAADSDHERPINDRGRRDAPEMARRFLARGMRLELILASDARRAQETIQLMREVWGEQAGVIQNEAQLYLASSRAILKLLEQQDSAVSHLAAIGHNPGMGELAMSLGAPISGMPTAAIVTFEYENLEDWILLSSSTASGIVVDFPKQPYSST